MNKLFKKSTLISAAACGVLLVSCREEGPGDLIQPSVMGTEIAQAPPVMTSALRLTKFGGESLIYHADGRIKQVIGTANVNLLGYSAYRVDYEYNGNAIVATRYEDNVKDSKQEWQLEDGRAVSQKRTKYYSDGATVTKTIQSTYHYNDQRQLIKVVKVDDQTRTYTLTYDNLGNVVKFLLVRNTDKGDEYENAATYEYTAYVGGPLENDKGGVINTHVFGEHTLQWLGDPYLPIFGKFGKSLLRKLTPITFGVTYKFNYTLDANGYVKKMTKLKKNGELVETKQLTYAVPAKNRF